MSDERMIQCIRDLLEVAEQSVDTRRCSIGILRAMSTARGILADIDKEQIAKLRLALKEKRDE